MPMLIGQRMKLTALAFAQEQPTQKRQLEVYRQTLAVATVNNYLRILGIETALEASDSWHPAIRLATDAADLLTVRGRLECRPVGIGDTHCPIPLEARYERIGYVLVQLESDEMASILGLYKPIAIDCPDITIADLHSIIELPQYLAKLPYICEPTGKQLLE